jgi:hypothetical protein
MVDPVGSKERRLCILPPNDYVNIVTSVQDAANKLEMKRLHDRGYDERRVLTLTMTKPQKKDKKYLRASTYSVTDQRQPHTFKPFEITVTDPLKICANDEESLFAVLTSVDVEIWKRDQKNFTAHWHPAKEPTYYLLSDVCWAKKSILVSDKVNHCVYQVEPTTATRTAIIRSAAGLMISPLTLAADHTGRVWVGCLGGDIVSFSPDLPSASSPSPYENEYYSPTTLYSNQEVSTYMPIPFFFFQLIVHICFYPLYSHQPSFLTLCFQVLADQVVVKVLFIIH